MSIRIQVILLIRGFSMILTTFTTSLDSCQIGGFRVYGLGSMVPNRCTFKLEDIIQSQNPKLEMRNPGFRI